MTLEEMRDEGLIDGLDYLCARIEIAWNNDRSDRLVDQLATANPDIARDLYEFFALLIYAEIGDGHHEANRP